jgi:hypothetical protein
MLVEELAKFVGTVIHRKLHIGTNRPIVYLDLEVPFDGLTIVTRQPHFLLQNRTSVWGERRDCRLTFSSAGRGINVRLSMEIYLFLMRRFLCPSRKGMLAHSAQTKSDRGEEALTFVFPL